MWLVQEDFIKNYHRKRWLGFLQNELERQDCPYENFKFDWKELVSFFKMIELDSLAKLKAPTENVFMTVRPLQV
jgi:hypothetical protein